MASTFMCPNCRRLGSVMKALPRGAKLRCPGCHLLFVPDLDGESPTDGDKDRPSREILDAAFATLGLCADATSQQVKVAYRDLVQVWHPDRFAHNSRLVAQAQANMIKINQSYGILRDHFARMQDEVASHSKSWDSYVEAKTDPDQDDFFENFVSDVNHADERTPRERAHSTKPETKICKNQKQGWIKEWAGDPILRWAFILPAIILIPFFCYLVRESYLAHYRSRIVELSSEAITLAAEKRTRAAYDKNQELLAYANSSDPGSDESRNAVMVARAEVERLHPVVESELAAENRQWEERLGQIISTTLALTGVGAFAILVIWAVARDEKRRILARALATKMSAMQSPLGAHRGRGRKPYRKLQG